MMWGLVLTLVWPLAAIAFRIFRRGTEGFKQREEFLSRFPAGARRLELIILYASTMLVAIGLSVLFWARS